MESSLADYTGPGGPNSPWPKYHGFISVAGRTLGKVRPAVQTKLIPPT